MALTAAQAAAAGLFAPITSGGQAQSRSSNAPGVSPTGVSPQNPTGFISTTYQTPTEQPIKYSERYFSQKYQGYTVLCDKIKKECWIPFPIKAN